MFLTTGISARSHVGAATLGRALERMDAACEEHMAKLSVNAMIGLWAAACAAAAASWTGRGRTSPRPSPTRGAWCGTSSTPGGNGFQQAFTVLSPAHLLRQRMLALWQIKSRCCGTHGAAEYMLGIAEYYSTRFCKSYGAALRKGSNKVSR